MKSARRLAALVAGAGLGALFVATAFAHGNPELSIDRTVVAPGDAILVSGAEFEEDLEVHIELIGVGGTVELTDVTIDAEGVFAVEVSIPDGTAPGSYRIAARGEDEVVSLDLEVVEGSGGAGGPAAPPVPVDGTTSDTLTAALAFALGGVGLLGAVLVWRR